MALKFAILFLTIWICAACATGPAQERAPEHIRSSVYYLNKGANLFAKGCYTRAMDYFQDAHQLYSAADDQVGVVLSLNNIADTYFRLGDMDSALLVYDDAVALARNEKHHPGLAWALSNKAAALIALNRLKEAAVVLDQTESIAKNSRDKSLYLKTRALLLIQEQHYQQVQTLLEEALNASEDDGDGIKSSIYFAMGHVLMLTNQPEKARARFDQALTLDRNKTVHHDIARDLEAIGKTYAAVGNYQQAVYFFKRSAKIYALLQDSRRTKAAVANIEISASLANIDTQTTMHWIQTWLADKSGSAICD